MNQVLEGIYRTGRCVDLAGKERKVTGAVPREDALPVQGPPAQRRSAVRT